MADAGNDAALLSRRSRSGLSKGHGPDGCGVSSLVKWHKNDIFRGSARSMSLQVTDVTTVSRSMVEDTGIEPVTFRLPASILKVNPLLRAKLQEQKSDFCLMWLPIVSMDESAVAHAQLDRIVPTPYATPTMSTLSSSSSYSLDDHASDRRVHRLQRHRQGVVCLGSTTTRKPMA